MLGNGTKFYDYERVEEAHGVPFYFATPYHLWVVSVRPTRLDDGHCDQFVVLDADQRCGSNSAIWLFGCVGNRSSTSRRYAEGSCPLSRAECTRLITAAARWPARRLPANSQLLRPIAIGRTWFSTQLLSIGSSPSSMKRTSACQRFKL
jgi:hypothetical protein